MKREREYRAIYTSIRHHPDFLPMLKDAKAYFWMLKAELHVSGIGAVMPHTIAGLASLSLQEAEQAERELESRGWIKRDGAVVWIVNGLRHTPNMRPKDAKHRKYIAAHLKTLPKSGLVEAFREHYRDWFAEAPTEAPSEGPSEGASGESTDKTVNGRKKKIQQKASSPAGAGASKGRDTWITPFAVAWQEQYGGEMPIEPALRPLRKLIGAHGDAEALRRWKLYLAATDGSFASAPRFAATWGKWGAPPPAVLEAAASERNRKWGHIQTRRAKPDGDAWYRRMTGEARSRGIHVIDYAYDHLSEPAEPARVAS